MLASLSFRGGNRYFRHFQSINKGLEALCRKGSGPYPNLSPPFPGYGGSNLFTRHFSTERVDNKSCHGESGAVTGETLVNERSQISLLCFVDGEHYKNYFQPAVHAQLNQCRDTDVTVHPSFVTVGGVKFCSIANGVSAVKHLYPGQYNIGGALIGLTVFLVPSTEGQELERKTECFRCRIVQSSVVGVGCDEDIATSHETNCGELILLIEGDGVDTKDLEGRTFTLMQQNHLPIVISRMLETLHEFANTGLAMDGRKRPIKSPKISCELYNALMCRQMSEKEDADSVQSVKDLDLASASVEIAERTAGRLNKCQLDVVRKVFTQALTLIRGPPGSGKTTVAAAIAETALLDFKARQVDRRSSKILVCATSNVAANNLCEKLLQCGLRAIRLNARSGSFAAKTPASVKPYCFEELVLETVADEQMHGLLQHFYAEDFLTSTQQGEVNQLRYKLENKVLHTMCDVVVTTCAAARDGRLEGFLFPVVLVDEVTQSYEPETLMALMTHSERVVLIGDPCQLSAVPVDCPVYGYRLISLFNRLILAGVPTEFLDTQYRMHPSLAEFSNRVFYNGELRDGVSTADRTPQTAVFPWPASEPLVFIHHEDPHTSVDHSYTNEKQASVVMDVVSALCGKGVEAADIGIITPYDAQRTLLKTLVHSPDSSLSAVEVCSVDEFQGREKDYIVVSCVRSGPGGASTATIGFLDNPCRLNVTLTRARYGMAMIGNADQLASASPVWRDFVADMAEKQCLVTGDVDHLQPYRVEWKRTNFKFELNLGSLANQQH